MAEPASLGARAFLSPTRKGTKDMRRFFVMTAVAAVGALALAATASAVVPRYQEQSATLTADVLAGSYVHTYTIAIDPCDGSFAGTGGIASLGLTETVSGTLSDGYLTIDFDALYQGPFAPYAWSYTGPLSGGIGYGPNGQTFTVAFALANVVATSAWKNHGQYVKAMGGGAEAAQSCLGKPIPYSWSTSGTIAPTMTGATVTLPLAGRYRIDVAGTWTNGQWGWVDAEYTNDGAGGYADGFDRAGYLLGPDFGDLMVGGTFVDWGAYSALHAYSFTGSFAGGPLSLAVFDGAGGVAVPGWYGDNTGGLDYTITYVGE